MYNKTFIILHCAAFVLLTSWLFPPTRAAWECIDQSLFYFLNGSLDSSSAAQAFWALANHKITDIISAVLMGAIFLICVKAYHTQILPILYYSFCIIVGTALITKFLAEPTFAALIGKRISPSLTLNPVIFLSQKIDWITVKDTSRDSFPGDHTAVLAVWAGLLISFTGRKIAWIAIPYVILLSLPRLVSGAHWATDDLVGSVSIACIILAWSRYFHPEKQALNTIKA